MSDITIAIPNVMAARWLHILRRRYGKDGRTGLEKLIKLAVMEIVNDETMKWLDEIQQEVEA